MERPTQIKQELEELYKQLIEKRLEEYKKKLLTGRLVIDINKGEIIKMYDQATIAGITTTSYYLDKVLDF